MSELRERYEKHLTVLEKAFPPEIVEEKRQGGSKISFVPWHHYVRRLNAQAPGDWSSSITDYKAIEAYTVEEDRHTGEEKEVRVTTLLMTVRVTVSGVSHEAVGAADASKTAWGGAMAEAFSQAFRRACAMHGLGLYFYSDEDPYSQDEPDEPEPDPDAPTATQRERLTELGAEMKERGMEEELKGFRDLLESSWKKSTAGMVVREMKELLGKE